MLKNEKFEKKSLSDRQLCAIIWDIYEEKIKADKADDAVQNQRDEMDEFVFEMYLHKYGLYKTALRQMVKLASALVDGVGAHFGMVQLFKRFCGLPPQEGHDAKPLRREVLDVYLRCYTAICPPPDKSKAPEPAPETDVCERWVPLKWVRAGMKAGLAKDLAHGPLNELVTALGDSTEELTIKTPPVRPPE